MGGILLGYLAVLVFGIVSLVALGLLIGRVTKAARIVFASGLLAGALIMAFAVLTFLSPSYHPEDALLEIALAALTLVVMGAGQFIAALRSLRVFGVVILFAAASLVIAILPVFGGEWTPPGLRLLSPQISVPLSLFVAIGGLLLAVFLPSGSKPIQPAGPRLRNPAADVDPTGITV
jgi:hypothetical protein